MGKTRSKEIVKQEFYDLLSEHGFSVVEDTYETAHSKIKCADSDGYLYEIKQNVFIYSKNSSKWRANKYCDHNFELFMKLNYPDIILIDKYINNSTKIKATDTDGYLYSLSPNKLINNNRNPTRWHYNDYIIENIKHWLELNQPTQKLKDGQGYTGLKSDMIFVCEKHGEYKQKFFVKKYMGCNCQECSKSAFFNNGFYIQTLAERNKEEWKLIDATVYIVKLMNELEEFYKIGITRKDTVISRFSRIPYSVEVLKIIDTNLYEAIYLESILHDENKEYSYIPNIKFDGYTECFYDIKHI